MTVQIERLILFSHDGRRRDVIFRLGALNIITGASRTGKTSIIDIIDYCLGRETFPIAEGVIRQRVSWYGVILDNGVQQLLVARPAPESKRKSAAAAYISHGSPAPVPDAAVLEPNTNTDGALAAIADLIGLDLTPVPLQPGLTPDYAVTPRHVTFFMFQRQDEILSRDFLFHRQGEDYIPKTIRDVLPFFLGSISRGDLALLRRLDELRSRLRRLQSEIAEIERMSDADGAVGRRLVQEAEASGLSPELDEADDIPALRARLEAVARFGETLSLDTSPRGRLADDAAESRRQTLLSERESLRLRLAEVRERIATVREVTVERSTLGGELQEQHARLRSLQLLPSGDFTHCPVCENELGEEAGLASELADAVAHVAAQISTLPSGTRSATLLAQLDSEAAQLRLALSENASALATLEDSAAAMRQARDERQEQARVLGRVSLYLESVRVDPRLGGLTADRARVAVEIEDIEQRVSADLIASRTEYALARIGADMTAFARAIEMEYSDNPLRLDRRALTVVADSAEGQIPMNLMGSGANWVGCHLVAHLALHTWFSQQKSPVINTVFFDQPSEVYFPADRERAGGESDESGDRAAAGRMLKLTNDAVVLADGSFQVILTEHADLAEPWFEQAVVERWRGGEALVPEDWPDGF